VSITTAILGLMVLIVLHELGHFGAAKAVGMRVIRFSLFFPPTLVRRRVGDTEYALGATPLGGYVKIPGMLRPEATDLYEVEDLLERNEGLPEEHAAAIGAALDDVRRELGRVGAEAAAAALDRLRDALAAAREHLSDRERRRTDRAVRRVAEALDPRSYWRSPIRHRLIVIAAGPLVNVLVAFLILTGVALTGKPQPAIPIPRIALVQGDTPAERAGLRVGDRLVAVDGAHGDTEDFRDAIQGSGGQPIRLVVVRDGERVTLGPVRAVEMDGAYRLGFAFGSRLAPTKEYGPIDAVGVALDDMWRMVTGTFDALSRIGTSEGRSQFSGPIGIVRYTSDAADVGAPYYFTLVAVISMSLAIFNLLPFLPLDGGHIFLLLLERLRGRAISRPAFERVSAVGIMLMLLLFVIGLQNDIGNLTGTTP
jgi:regulator of sigma E protease